MHHLSDEMLEHLVDDVDGVDHVALVLCVETSPGTYDPVALARIVRYADVPDAADLAVTVKDAWQGRGVATVLLEVLMRHRPPGVQRIVTEVFNDNPASLGMLRRLGAVTEQDNGFGVYGVVVEPRRRPGAYDRGGDAPRRPAVAAAAGQGTPPRTAHARPGLPLVPRPARLGCGEHIRLDDGTGR